MPGKDRYIKIAEDHISSIKKIIADLKKSKDHEKQALIYLETAENWLNYLKSGRNDPAGAEAIMEKIYNINNKPSAGYFLTVNCFFVPELFKHLYGWAKETGLLTENIKRWKNELYTIEADSINESYEAWEELPRDGHIPVVTSILKKWINLINTDFATQQNVDDLINPFMNWQSVSGSTFWATAEEIRCWAELEGFRVVSREDLDKHFNQVFYNNIEKNK